MFAMWNAWKRPSKADTRDFFLLMGCQFLSYFIYSVNARALAQGRMAWTFFTDLIFAAVNYTIIKQVSESKSNMGRLGYVLGGAWGSLLAILLTKKLFGQ